jgi:putative nucleotidyltransferase-like protein
VTGTAADERIGHSPLARAIASSGLAGSMLEFPSAPLSHREFTALLGHVQMQRTTGLLWDAITSGRLPVAGSQTEQAEELHLRALCSTLLLEQLLLDTIAALRKAGVDVRVLKGSAAAHLDYPDPSLRTFGDIDLLVRSDQFETAVTWLTDQGYTRLYPQPRPGFDRNFSKGTSFLTPGGLEIDLHRTLAMGPYGIRLDLDRLWQGGDSFTLGGSRLRALAPESRLLHACYHVVLGDVRPRLIPLRDVAQIALGHHLDLGSLHELVRASRGQAVVAKAVRLAWQTFALADVLSISAWAAAYRTDPREAADIAVYGKGSSYASKSVAAIRSIPTTRGRASYLYALLVPTASYLEPRHSSRLARLRSGWRQTQISRGRR